MRLRYFPSTDKGAPATVKLGPAALAQLEPQQQPPQPDLPEPSSSSLIQEQQLQDRMCNGHQIRHHPIAWKKIATFEALRLFLADFWSNSAGNGSNNDNDESHPDDSRNKEPSATTLLPSPPPWIQVMDYVKIANEAALRRDGNGSWKGSGKISEH